MTVRHLGKLAPLLALFAFQVSSARAESAYQIPWRDIPASRCAIMVEPAFAGGSVVTLRCEGHVDVFLTRCSADRCAP